jgi:hypothetical protein
MEDLMARGPLTAQVGVALFLFHLSYSRCRQYIVPPSLYRGDLKLGPVLMSSRLAAEARHSEDGSGWPVLAE